MYHPHDEEQDETRERRNAVNRPQQLWPGGIVPYEIATAFSSKIIIKYLVILVLQYHRIIRGGEVVSQ